MVGYMAENTATVPLLLKMAIFGVFTVSATFDVFAKSLPVWMGVLGFLPKVH